MALSSIALILISCLFHSWWNILTQASKNSQYFSGLKGVWIMLLGVCFLATQDLLTLPAEIYFWTAVSGVLHGVYILSLSKAYSSQDISYVYPIARSAPVFVPPLAWLFLNETLTSMAWFSIGLIVLAIYILHFDGQVVSGFKKLFDAILHRDLRWAFITLGLVVSYSLVDKRGMEVFFKLYPEQAFRNGLQFFFMESFVGFSVCLGYLFLMHPKEEIISSWKGEWRLGIIAGITTVGSYGLICVVLQFENVSTVVSLRQISVLMVVLWGCLKLKEPFGKQRIIASLLIILGVFLMKGDY